MMNTNEDPVAPDDGDSIGLLAKLKRELGTALLAGLGIGLVYGGLTGFLVVFSKDTFSIPAFLVCVVVVAIGMPILVYAYRKSPSLRDGDPDTPRGRRMGKMMFLLMAFTIVVILPFVIRGDTLQGVELFSNGPVPQWLALFLAALWLIGMPLIGYFNRKNMDELERKEFQFGETLAFQFFGVAAPVWWIAARGGLAPEPDVMILFIAVLTVAVFANLYRKLA